MKEPKDRPIDKEKGRPLTMLEFMDVVRQYAATIPGGRTVLQDISQGGFSPRRGGFPVEIDIRGRDWDALAKASRQIIDEMQKTGLVTDVDSDYQVGMPEVQVVPDRNRAADLGVSMADIGETVNSAIGGPAGGQVQGQGAALRHPGAPARQPARAARRTSSGCSCAPQAGSLVPLRDLVKIRAAAHPPGHHPQGPRARDHHLRQRGARAPPRPRPSSARSQIARRRSSPTATAPCPRAAPRPSRSRSTRCGSPSCSA